MLEAIGLSGEEERLYRLLLTRPRADPTDLAEAVHATPQRVEAWMTSLEAIGLVGREPGPTKKYIAAPPEVAVHALLQEKQRALDRARSAVPELSAEAAREGADQQSLQPVEVIQGRSAVAQRFAQLQQSAEKEVLVFDKPPYSIPSSENDLEKERLRDGIKYRTLYDRTALEEEGQLTAIRDLIRSGEEARIITSVPVKLAIADERLALLPLNMLKPGMEGGLLIYESPLLDVLRLFFDAMWSRASAMPFTDDATTADGSRDHPLSDEEQQIMAFLAAGIKDEVVAREMGIALRTFRRRVRSLMERLGVRSRFQAGVEAAKRGWL